MHLSSLPSPYGIGTMGKEAKKFVDFLKEAGQTYWQLLPIGPTGYGDSPYQSYSTFAGNPYFIDLDELVKEGLLYEEELHAIKWESEPSRVNYGALYEKRYEVLAKATERFLKAPSKEFDIFCRENTFWLNDYALFMTCKDNRSGQGQSYWKALQYFFFQQWANLKRYANEQGVLLIGDLPIYVSQDSVEVWAHPELFQMDAEGQPKEVAGCPPDGFSEDGQLWGNPLYDWEHMEEDRYSWWTKRIEYLCAIYDVLRIDHFRGFAGYYAIPYGETTAKNGRWRKGPGMKLFDAVEDAIGKKFIIAEDLGHITEDVRQLLKESGFPGMKVLQFAFDSRDEGEAEYLPHHYEEHCVAYAGTHDNNTIMGWFEETKEEDVAYAREYLGMKDGDEPNWAMMDALWKSRAELVIVTAQDILGLGSQARMNEPSTVGRNWQWRALPGAFTTELAKKLKGRMKQFER